MEVLADEKNYPHRWRDLWTERVAGIPTWDRQTLTDKPWCRIIKPYLSEDGTLPEGQLDFPCALGIDQTRQRFEEVIVGMASGIRDGGVQ